MPFHTTDWLILAGYIFLSIGAGVLFRKFSGRNLDSFLLAGRSIPGWLLGISMAATTFAADTPLAITGLIAEGGISANWFWWSWAFTFAAMAVFFSRRWRSSRVLTDAEFIELRYSGPEAAVLRMTKAFFLSIVLNSLIMGWVFNAMARIADPFIRWDAILGDSLFQNLSVLLQPVIYQNLNNTLTVFSLTVIALIYSISGGLKSVIVTDLFQFILGIAGSFILLFYILDYTGGVEAILTGIKQYYPDKAEGIISFWPAGNGSIGLDMFLIFILIQWWSKYFSDGSGYFAQRINSARSPDDAASGSLIFALVHIVIRTWPWVIAGLAALVVFPPGSVESGVLPDRESAYPYLMKMLLPAGMLGLVFTSLAAAFMSTIDTHIHWGASYLTNDIYYRFINRQAGQKRLVIVSRINSLLITLISVFIATRLHSIAEAWKLLIAFASGMGLPQILRWLWHRANAYTELAGMISGFLSSLLLITFFDNMPNEYVFLYSALVSAVISIAATFLTRPVERKHLLTFARRVSPSGFWGDISPGAERNFFDEVYIWASLSTALISLLMAPGYFILADYSAAGGWALAATGATLLYRFQVKSMQKRKNQPR